MSDSTDLEIPGVVTLTDGAGGLPKVLIETPWSSAEIYLHGAHVTHFQKKGEPPLLFMSESSEFSSDKPIRGGVPIIFPWFGAREGLPAHGFARTAAWRLTATSLRPDGSVGLFFHLPAIGPEEVEFTVSVGETLAMELIARNASDTDLTFETCLHTYFEVSAIHDIAITGLAGVTFLDKVAGTTATETPAPIRITGEVDRVYQDTTTAVEIEDPGYGRIIRVAKSGSTSTVVWNPWIDKSQRMPDFGDHEYLHMVCVESGNVAANKITLPAGECAVMEVVVSSAKIR